MRQIPKDVRQHFRAELRAQGRTSADEAAITDALVEFAVEAVSADLARRRRLDETRRGIFALLQSRQPDIVFQPIFSSHGGMEEIEALSRFDTSPYRSPDQWFTEADEVGMGIDLEEAAIRNALSAYRALRGHTPARLAVNASIKLVLSGRLAPLLSEIDPSSLVIELTEQQAVPCYRTLNACLAPMRERGIRVAVDDMGAGAAGVQHLLGIRPDVLKADRGMVQGLDGDPMKMAMMEAVVVFARGLGISVTAEGVETTAELDALRSIGVDAVQGYLLAKPMTAAALLRSRELAA